MKEIITVSLKSDYQKRNNSSNITIRWSDYFRKSKFWFSFNFQLFSLLKFYFFERVREIHWVTPQLAMVAKVAPGFPQWWQGPCCVAFHKPLAGSWIPGSNQNRNQHVYRIMTCKWHLFLLCHSAWTPCAFTRMPVYFLNLLVFYCHHKKICFLKFEIYLKFEKFWDEVGNLILWHFNKNSIFYENYFLG